MSDNNICPKCGSKDILDIVYGMPSYYLFKEAEENKVVLGGCVIGFNDPEFHCNNCGFEWSKEDLEKLKYD